MSNQIPTFPKLYKISNTKKIYEWNICITESPHESPNKNQFEIVTFHGEKEGKKIKHSTLISKGKVNRSVLQQAILETQSKWNNKYNKSGYRPNGEIEKQIIRPMLASPFKLSTLSLSLKKSRAKNIVLPCAIQRKYDGIRCIASFHQNEIVLETRSGTKIDNFNCLRKELKELYISLNYHLKDTHFYFDGELYTDEFPFEELNGLVRKKKDKVSESEIEKMNKIKFNIFDFFDLDRIDLTFQHRNDELNVCINKNKNDKYITLAPTYIAKTVDDVSKFHEQFVKEGFEGTILRNLNSVYQLNKRSKDLQKYKDFVDEEFPIIGFKDGVGKDTGLVVWKCVTPKGVEFEVVPNGTQLYRSELFKNGNDYIGKMLTVVFQGYTRDGSLRFAKGKDIRFDL